MCDNEKIGAYIASLRKAAGLTQTELGERLGVTGQAVSGWERGEFLPDTGILQDLALILDTSVDALLGGGSCGWRYRRRVTVEQMTEAIACIRRMQELLGADHFFYRTMVDALDERMHSSVEMTFAEDRYREAYVVEALCECARHGDYVDLTDVQRNIHAERPRDAGIATLRELGMK